MSTVLRLFLVRQMAGLATLSGAFHTSAVSPLAEKGLDWPALLALLIGVGAGFVALRVGSRVLKELGCDACWSKQEPLLPVLARRSDAPQPPRKTQPRR